MDTFDEMQPGDGKALMWYRTWIRGDDDDVLAPDSTYTVGSNDAMSAIHLMEIPDYKGKTTPWFRRNLTYKIFLGNMDRHNKDLVIGRKDMEKAYLIVLERAFDLWEAQGFRIPKSKPTRYVQRNVAFEEFKRTWQQRIWMVAGKAADEQNPEGVLGYWSEKKIRCNAPDLDVVPWVSHVFEEPVWEGPDILDTGSRSWANFPSGPTPFYPVEKQLDFYPYEKPYNANMKIYHQKKKQRDRAKKEKNASASNGATSEWSPDDTWDIIFGVDTTVYPYMRLSRMSYPLDPPREKVDTTNSKLKRKAGNLAKDFENLSLANKRHQGGRGGHGGEDSDTEMSE